MAPGNGKSGMTRPTSPITNATTAISPSITTKRTTRSATQGSSMLRANVNVENYTVKDAESGLKYLESKLLCVVGEPINSEHLMTALFNISQLKNVPRPATEAIRAIAYLIGEQETSKAATTISAQVKEIISGEVASQVVIAISPHMANLLQTAERMETNTKELEKLIGRTNEQATPSQSQTRNADTPSYSDAVKNAHAQHPMIDTAVARAGTKERQILLEAIEGESLYKPGQTAASIAKEVQKILITIKQDDSPDLNIKAITKLKNGGLILELDSASSVKWLRKEGNRERFLNALETPAEMKDRTYTVIVPFVPISTPIEETDWRRALEMENDIPENSVSLAKWIKPKHKRAPNQRVAHILLQLADPHSANKVMKDGLYVCKEKLCPHKDKKEPTRCAKCQRWGHIAANCHAECDACATCGEEHRSSECTSQNVRYCVSCENSGHASNDRHCPTYEQECAILDARHPENSMPYFPTNESWTQVLLPPKPAPYRNQTLPSMEPNPGDNDHVNFRQTTLDLAPGQSERQKTKRPPFPTRGYIGTRGVRGTRGRFSPASSSNRIPIGSQRQNTQRTLTSFLNINANTNTIPDHPPPSPKPSPRQR